MTLAVEDAKKVNHATKKLAAQFSKAAKVQQLTAQLRTIYGTSITRKQLKVFERTHKLVVQWVARREEPTQGFRTPLGFVRSGRGEYAIPAATAREEVLVNEAGVPVTGTAPITVEAGEFPTSGVVEPVTVTEVPGGPGRDVREVAETPDDVGINV